jgi:hypothetical protein
MRSSAVSMLASEFRKGKSEVALAVSAKGGSRQSRNPGLIQQPVCNLFAGLAKSRDVGEEIKRAMGFQTSDSWNRVQSIDENIAAPAELLNHVRDNRRRFGENASIAANWQNVDVLETLLFMNRFTVGTRSLGTTE